MPLIRLEISLADQTLEWIGAGGERIRYAVSTATNGAGCVAGSHCTPVGLHRIRMKIGRGCPLGTVFVSRRPTGEVYSEELGRAWPDRDWILSRILWLDGLVPGLNSGGNVDSLRRFIYIHGTSDEALIGTPASHGCIRMRNTDVIELFDRIETGALVDIRR